jgi:hypothetical protein
MKPVQIDKIDKFFPPSAQLTQRLTQTMRDQSVRDLQHTIASVEGADQVNSDGSEPWTDYLGASTEAQPTREEIAADQRYLSEILYGYLARLAHSQGSGDSRWFNFVEVIPPGMSNRLGLDDSEGLALLEEFAIEFQRWLSKCSGRSFEAGWGLIWVDAANPERFGLKRFSASFDQERKVAAAKVNDRLVSMSAGAGRSGEVSRKPLPSDQ